MIEKIFERSACVKPWEGDAENKPAAKKSFSSIPSTDFMISAAIGNIVDPVSGRKIDVPMPSEGVVYIVQENGWETLEFDELAKNLTELHSNIDNTTRKMLRESEITLIQMRKGIEDESPLNQRTPAPTIPKILEPV